MTEVQGRVASEKQGPWRKAEEQGPTSKGRGARTEDYGTRAKEQTRTRWGKDRGARTQDNQ